MQILSGVRSPVDPRARIESIDVLRGVAVLGIVLINVLFFSQPLPWLESRPWTSTGDRVAFEALMLLVFGKFFSIFAFLFGLGFGLQLERSDDGTATTRTYRRRLLILLLFGIAHVVFVWYGDVLHVYALLGFLLVRFRRSEPRRLLRAAAISACIPIALVYTAGGIQSLRGDRAAMQQMLTESRELARVEAAGAIAAYRDGDWQARLDQRLHDLGSGLPITVIMLPQTFALFLIGMWAARRRLFETPDRWKSIQWWGLSIGAPLTIAWTIGRHVIEPIPSIATATLWTCLVLGAPSLAAFYAATIVRSAHRSVLRPFAFVGRMALTNYLLQSIVLTAVFYGFDLFARVGPAGAAAIAIAFYAMQAVASAAWLRRFRFGPCEWLWRSLTYGKLESQRPLVSVAVAVGAGDSAPSPDCADSSVTA